MPHEETSAAVAGILSHLAKQYDPTEGGSYAASAISNGSSGSFISLPGEDTVEKQTMERELSALASRIQYLETKANGSPSLPITPNEPNTALFAQAETPVSPGQVTNAPRQRSSSFVHNFLAKPAGEPYPRDLTQEQFSFLREHIEKQAEQIRQQEETIGSIRSEMSQQSAATKNALDTLGNSASIDQLKREIEKNAQINATYQKVLREIGTIITAVAAGDLSKKVLIQTTEKDPEIARFKTTINTMVDQLQEFASQVTHLAKEVGTEGRLGGQAVVPNVAGIWAELTQNGK